MHLFHEIRSRNLIEMLLILADLTLQICNINFSYLVKSCSNKIFIWFSSVKAQTFQCIRAPFSFKRKNIFVLSKAKGNFCQIHQRFKFCCHSRYRFNWSFTVLIAVFFSERLWSTSLQLLGLILVHHFFLVENNLTNVKRLCCFTNLFLREP